MLCTYTPFAFGKGLFQCPPNNFAYLRFTHHVQT